MTREARGIIRDLVAAVLNKDAANVTDAEIAAQAPNLAYINPIDTPPAAGGSVVNVAPWPAFPRAVERRGSWAGTYPPVPSDGSGVHRAAEHLGDEDHRPGQFVDKDDNLLHLPVRDRQDEYLEWASRHDEDGRLTKVTFVAEGYDYYSALFEHDEPAAVQLYRHFVGDNTIRADDLRAHKGVYRRLNDGSRITVVDPGAFNPRNRFNINPGIVHLSHRANSLGAEVNLAGVSGILRLKADGTLLDGNNEEELFCCCQGGNPNRNSDPSISKQAYQLVRGGNRYTLADPVGLYIAEVDNNRVTTPDGQSLTDDWWTVVRGSGFASVKTSRVLRLEIAPPKGSKLTLEDLSIGGQPVRFAGQLARIMSVHLFVEVWKASNADFGPRVNCIGTCCRKNGTSELAITGSSCPPGYALAFPGLIKAPQQALSLHAATVKNAR